jgi:hypothetical protein
LATGQDGLGFIAVDDVAIYWTAYNSGTGNYEIRAMNKLGGPVCVLKDGESTAYAIEVRNGALFWSTSASSGTIRQRDSIAAFVTASGTIRIVHGSDIAVETSAITASSNQDLTVIFDSTGTITLAGFTTGDGDHTGSSWPSISDDLYYGCLYSGLAQLDGLISEPIE